jgi:Pyridoxamine 5'-phosphate oxidase/WS/DGAT C-terminal domain
VSLGPSIAVALTFVWLGMVLAISFLEAPLKFRAPGTNMRRYATVEVSLEDVARICDGFEVTVNDVALAAITDSFRTMLIRRGEQPQRNSLRTLVPVSVRSNDATDKTDNRVSVMLPYLPVDKADPIAPLRTVHARLTKAKASGQRQAGNIFVSAANAIPFRFTAWTVRALTRLPQRGVVTSATNVPGPRKRLHVMGREVIRLLPIPPLALQLRTGIAIMSYADHLVRHHRRLRRRARRRRALERHRAGRHPLNRHEHGPLAFHPGGDARTGARRLIVMPTGHELEVLNRRQCLDLLATVRVGRLVFTEDALPAVQPVNFRLWRDDLVIRVAGGPKLAAATNNLVVAFQADELDPDLRTGWSVTVVGHAQPITDVSELVELSGTFLQPWVDGRRDHFVRIQTEKMTGRRFREPGLPQYRSAAGCTASS